MNVISVGSIRGDQFVRAVMYQIDADGPIDLARKARLKPWYVDKRIRNWIQGRNEPNFKATILLLQAAGWLDEQGLSSALAMLSDGDLNVAGQNDE